MLDFKTTWIPRPRPGVSVPPLPNSHGALWFPVGIGLLLYFTKCEKYGLFWPFSTAPIIVLCYIQGTWSFACLCFKLLFFLHLKCYCTRCDLFFFFFWIKAICPECWLVDDGTHLCPQPDELRVLEYNQSSGQIGLTSPLKLAHSTSHSVSFTVYVTILCAAYIKQLN